MMQTVALIGFGEAGSTFARAGNWGVGACAYDIDAARQAVMTELGLTAATTLDQALGSAQLVLSLVTADQAGAAALDASDHLTAGTLWCDMNSVSPDTKRAAARAVTAAGGRYVDVAVLAPVDPAGLTVPLLLSGPDAAAGEAALRSLGFSNIAVAGDDVGRASAIKMIRSVMVKGIEALSDEMMQAAEAAGVSAEVLASLDASERKLPWTHRAAYNRERMATHGLRRAAEMDEVAKTLAALGIDPVMSRATAILQRGAALTRKQGLKP